MVARETLPKIEAPIVQMQERKIQDLPEVTSQVSSVASTELTVSWFCQRLNETHDKSSMYKRLPQACVGFIDFEFLRLINFLQV